MGVYKINVYDANPNIYPTDTVVARVQYNGCLDFWDGRNWSCGSTGRHKGLTVLKNGDFVLIEGTNWQGEKDIAYIIDEDEALNEVLKSGNLDLLKLKKFKRLKDLYLEKGIDDAEITDEGLEF